MQKHSFHQEGSDLGGSPEGREINPSGQTPMGTPVLSQQMEANSADETIKSFAENILRLGNECRDLARENQVLKHEAVHDIGRMGEQSAEIASLKAEVLRLERLVNYWRIEANVDHDRWLRSLEEIDHIRKLK